MDYEIFYKSVKHGYVRMQRDGSVHITIPRILRHNKKFEAELLVQAQKLRDKQQKKIKIEAIGDQTLLLFGEQVSLDEIGLSGIKAKGGKSTLDMFLEQTLYEFIEPVVQECAERIGEGYHSIIIKKLKSKRGSCSYDQKLVFNRDLVHLSTKIIHYVVVHEVCHLVEKNHSSAFWALVEKHYPDYKQARKELKGVII